MTRSGPRAAAAKPSKSKIEALLFDAGDLLYHRPHKGERWAAFLSEMGLTPSPMSRRERETLRAKAFVGQISRQEYFDTLLRLHGVHSEENLARGRRVLELDSDDVCFFDGVKETLSALKEQGLLLGIVTDTFQPEAVKRRWLEREGISHVWDVFVSSYEVGVCKPDPRIYQIALEALGVEPEAAAFVGHKASELEGAKAVGMTTVAFNRDEDADADFDIERFSQLQELPILPPRKREK